MATVDLNDLKEIFDTSLGDDPLNAHIGAAERLVERELSGEDSDIQDDVALYLAAHFASIQERREDSVSFGDASVSFEGDTGMGLSSSHYGQTAMNLDPTGSLKNIDNGRRTATVDLYN